MSDDSDFIKDSMDLLKDLPRYRIEEITRALTALSVLPDDQINTVLDYFITNKEHFSLAGIKYALGESQVSIVPNNPWQDFIFKGTYSVRILDRDGEPWFVAADVCKALEIANIGNALARLDADEKDDIRLADAIGRLQMTAVITESGLYNLILRSDKPEAREFKRWITHEVLPTLRKTGQYAMRALTPAEENMERAKLLLEHERALVDLHERVTVLEDFKHASEAQTGYYTIVGFASLKKIRIDNKTAQLYGMRAARLSRAQGYPIGEAPDTRHGKVGTYHLDILNAIFGIAGLPEEGTS